MDINLGAGIDGTEAAAIILGQRDLPVVFLSSHTEPEVVAKTEKITSYGYVVKNSSITVLDASIKMAFKLFEANTKEKVKEDALRESEEWNKLILSTVLSGVMVVEADTRKIVEINDTALKLIGLPKAQVIDAACHQFVCPAEEKNCPVLDLGKEVDLSEKILLTAAGKRIDILKTVVPVQLHGHRYLVESFVDISERKRAEAELLRKNKVQQVLNAYSYQVADMRYEELYPFVLKNAREIFQVKYVLISRYDETRRELVLEASSLSGDENSRLANLLGQKTLGVRFPVNSEMYGKYSGAEIHAEHFPA